MSLLSELEIMFLTLIIINPERVQSIISIAFYCGKYYSGLAVLHNKC